MLCSFSNFNLILNDLSEDIAIVTYLYTKSKKSLV